MSETECQQSILSSESVEIINEEIKRIEDIMKKQREQACFAMILPMVSLLKSKPVKNSMSIIEISY